LQDNLDKNAKLQGLYADPDLTLQNHPGEISDALQANIHADLGGITWNKAIIADFLGHFLTEPKSHVYFDAPDKISLVKFTEKLTKKTIQLHLKSQLLFTQNNFYLNGEKLNVPENLSACMRELADKRYLNTSATGLKHSSAGLQANIHAALGDVLYESYLAGFINFKK
jgi:50S ribosomal protein L16 3-hydroxylase